MRARTEHPLNLILNGRRLSRVIIDQHYRDKHGESIRDELILELVKTLDGIEIEADCTRDGFEYLKAVRVWLHGRAYRLVLLLSPADDFLGVINAFRVKGRK